MTRVFHVFFEIEDYLHRLFGGVGRTVMVDFHSEREAIVRNLIAPASKAPAPGL